MSVIQSTQKEVRYLKRKSLEEESRIVGNALRDQIRQYGVDCIYYKLSSTGWLNFKDVIDKNTILKRAYGYDMNPNYTLSAHMITYADAQQDIFLMNKIGVIPNPEIDFHFDKIDFACALATKCGQYKEYVIDEDKVCIQVPDVDDSISSHLSAYDLRYHCDMLSGVCRVFFDNYEYDKEYTIVCDPYEHTDFNVSFPANSDLYRSLKYTIENDDYLETLIYLTYKVIRIKQAEDLSVNLLSGYLHGSILFYDIESIGKYVELIHPMVGDIIEIDFPDDKNREKYEITDCYDKQLTQDGISPLLHKYIWKCKARRYINSYEDDTPQTDADDRVDEMHSFNKLIDEQVAKDISVYDKIGEHEVDEYDPEIGKTKKAIVDVNEDSAYGGYDVPIEEYDKQAPTPRYDKYDFVDDGQAIDLIRFKVGSRLLTNGYDLIFMNRLGAFYQITTNSIPLPSEHCMFEQNLRWLKATDSEIVFINVEGESQAIAIDLEATQGQLELCLNSLFDKSLDVGKPKNENDQNFYKFKGTRTYLWSDGEHLYAKLASNKQLYQVDGHIDKPLSDYIDDTIVNQLDYDQICNELSNEMSAIF